MLAERTRGRLGLGLYDEPADDGTGAGGGGGAPTPTFVPTEEFKQFQSQVLGTLSEMSGAMSALAANAKAGNAPMPKSTEPEVVTEEKYAESVREGDVETITKYHARKQYETIQQLAPTLQLGLQSVGNIVAEQAAKTLPHYARFRKDIDAYVYGMSPEMRMTPQAYEIAHNVIVGRNAAVLIQEGVEAALRNGATQGNPNPGGGGTSRTGGGGGAPPVPTVAELLGAEAEAALSNKGMDADAWSKRLGYKGGWPEYAGEIKKQRESA